MAPNAASNAAWAHFRKGNRKRSASTAPPPAAPEKKKKHKRTRPLRLSKQKRQLARGENEGTARRAQEDEAEEEKPEEEQDQDAPAVGTGAAATRDDSPPLNMDDDQPGEQPLSDVHYHLDLQKLSAKKRKTAWRGKRKVHMVIKAIKNGDHFGSATNIELYNPDDVSDQVRIQEHEIEYFAEGEWYSADMVDALIKFRLPRSGRGVRPGKAIADTNISSDLMQNYNQDTVADKLARLTTEPGLKLPFYLLDTIDEVVGAFNLGNMHFIAWRMRLVDDNLVVEIADSWTPRDVQLRDEHRLNAKNRTAELVGAYAYLEPQYTEPRWRRAISRWNHSVVLLSNVPQQVNDNDCGPHAVQNAIDFATRDSLKGQHNGKRLRSRQATIMQVHLEHRGRPWGDEHPQGDWMHEKWLAAPEDESQSGNEDPNDESSSNAVRNSNDQRGGSNVNLLSEMRVNRVLAALSWQAIVTAILYRSGHPLSARDITERFKQLEAPIRNSHDHGRRGGYMSLINEHLGRCSGHFLDTDITGKEKKYSLTTRVRQEFIEDSVASLYYGQDIAQQAQYQEKFADDLHQEPRIVVVVTRYSSAGVLTKSSRHGTSSTIARALAMAVERSHEILEYYDGVHASGRPHEDVEINNNTTRTELRQLLSDGSKRLVYHYEVTRSSTDPVFNTKDTPSDHTLKLILKTATRLHNPELLVTFTTAGLDGWSTHHNFATTLSELGQGIQLRYTIIADSDSVRGLSVFKERPHVQSSKAVVDRGYSWGHFDIHEIAVLSTALLVNGESGREFTQYQSSAFLHIMREVTRYKTHLYRDPQRKRTYLSSVDYPIGKTVLRRKRHTGMNFPKNPELRMQTCLECNSGTPTSGDVWERSPKDSANVICRHCVVITNPVIETSQEEEEDLTPARILRTAWTSTEDQTLLRLRKKGRTFPEIATQMGRTKNSCNNRFNRLTGWQP